MIGFGLLCGHLIGDYLLQNDWVAANKTNPPCHGRRPGTWYYADGGGVACGCEEITVAEYDQLKRAERVGHLACTVHCLFYTLAVWVCSFWWMPWWGLLACFAAHWPIDRFRLAARWMRNVSGQAFFASDKHPMFPWSIVAVDNTFHLLTLFGIALAVSQPWNS